MNGGKIYGTSQNVKILLEKDWISGLTMNFQLFSS